MGKPYGMDLRVRVVAAIEDGMSTRQAAARFSIGIATAGTWARLKRASGDVRPAKQGKPKGSVLDAHADFILGTLAAAPDTTLDEMVERLPLEDHHLRRRADARWLRRANAARWADERRMLPRLDRADAGTCPAAWPYRCPG